MKDCIMYLLYCGVAVCCMPSVIWASDCESICYVRFWLSCAVPYILWELVLSSCHESRII